MSRDGERGGSPNAREEAADQEPELAPIDPIAADALPAMLLKVDRFEAVLELVCECALVDRRASDDPLAAAITHLRQDPALSRDAADRIGRVMKEMYEALARPTHASAAHLRTASTLRPEAARLLGELLADMRQGLESEAHASR